MDAVTHRRHIVGLADRLMLEFAETMSPGQILRVVHRADRLVVHCTGDGQDAVALCEAIARRLICARVLENRRRDAASA